LKQLFQQYEQLLSPHGGKRIGTWLKTLLILHFVSKGLRLAIAVSSEGWVAGVIF
jgi:hypothetical protein